MRPPPESVAAGTDIGSVLSRLAGTDGGQLPVTNGERELVGVVTESDVIAAATSMITEPRSVEAAAEPGSGTERIASPSAGSFAGDRTATTREGTEAYSSQGVCESCGALSGDLQVQNGQSVCPDCRDV